MTLSISVGNKQEMRDLLGNGLLEADHFAVTLPAEPGLAFEVGNGVAYVNGIRIANDEAAYPLSVAAGNELPRFDIVQVGYDADTQAPLLSVKAGMPGETPVEPEADANCVKLYVISVAANASAIAADNVTDRRDQLVLNVSAEQVEGAATTGANTFTGEQAAPSFRATSPAAPLHLPNLAALPSEAGAEGTLCIVDGAWHYSTGSSWEMMDSRHRPASASQLGSIKIGSGLAVQEDGTLSADRESLGIDGANTYEGTQTAPSFHATSQTAPLQMPNLTEQPAEVGAAGTLCVVNGKWHISDGSAWAEMAEGGGLLPATTSQLGGVIVGSGLNVAADGTLSATQATLGMGGSNTYSGTQTAPTFEATSDQASFKVKNLGALPNVAAAGAMCVVGGKWHISDGTAWQPMAAGLAPATATQLGGVKVGEGINVSTDGTLDIVSTVLEPMRRDQLNFIDLAIEVETLKKSTLNGVTANIFIETFRDLTDILLLHGSHDSNGQKLILL